MRRPGGIVIDTALRIDPGQPPRRAAAGSGLDGSTMEEGLAGGGVLERGSAEGGSAEDTVLEGYRIEAVPGGWDITGPDGGRLLVAGGLDEVPDPPAGTEPFDLVLLDLLYGPAQLGVLRARGLVPDQAIAAALWADHRISSLEELARRCRLWRAVAPGDGDTLSTSGARASTSEAGAETVGARDGTAGARDGTAGTEDGTAGTEDGTIGARDGGAGFPHRALILGGARSGKSREAELRLAAEPRVTYVAAGPWPDGSWTGTDGRPDAEWAQRVAAHRAARPGWWETLETTDVAGALGRLRGAVLIDGIGTWLAAVMTEAGAWQEAAGQQAGGGGGDLAGRIAARVDELVAAWRQTGARVVAVSDQVGSGVVPATPSGRQFRDQLGWLNQRLSAESEQTVLVVAGRVLDLTT
jgi:adenosylcobinamide kinase/adenosylcobinamide-phosphate guanylyltransferase